MPDLSDFVRVELDYGDHEGHSFFHCQSQLNLEVVASASTPNCSENSDGDCKVKNLEMVLC